VDSQFIEMKVMPPTKATPESKPKTRLWLWFIPGFIIVLAAMMFRTIGFYTGSFVYRTSAWHYYLLEIQRAWNSQGNLGPTSGGLAAAMSLAILHFLCSVIGGVISMFAGWMIRKQSQKR
jgi:hypothetical protein